LLGVERADACRLCIRRVAVLSILDPNDGDRARWISTRSKSGTRKDRIKRRVGGK